jgi:HSP20 family molecular chaperone IbpA
MEDFAMLETAAKLPLRIQDKIAANVAATVEALQPSKIKATFKEGVLKVTFPKALEARKKKIKIKAA